MGIDAEETAVMATLEELFKSRVNAFREWPGLRPSPLGKGALGNPGLPRRIEAGCSRSLRTADRVPAFIGNHGRETGGARDPPSSPFVADAINANGEAPPGGEA